MEDERSSASESSGDEEGLTTRSRSKKCVNLGVQNRDRLRYLLNKLVKRRNWVDASGVLSVLLKGSCEERSPHHNRFKYTVARELLQYVESDSNDVEKLHELWIKKTAPKQNRLWKDKFVVFDSIVFFLAEKNYDRARSWALCLRCNREADNDPTSCLILGLCYYELWYGALPKERQLTDLHESELFDETEKPKTELYSDVANSKQDGNSSFKCHSETSVMNDKAIQMDNDVNRAMTNHSRVQGLYLSSDHSGSEGGSLDETNTNTHSAFFVNGVPDALLFPIQWDPLNENIGDVIKELRPNDDYKDAVEYLRKALDSAPSVQEALLPLVQILLLNDHVKEALDELEKFCHSSGSLFASRLKTHFFECLGCKVKDLHLSWYEDILQKDPTCEHSIKKLVRAYKMGDYDPVRLLEMIALHLDATFAGHEMWSEFASCLLKVCECGDEDRVSTTCLDGERSYQDKKIPDMFSKGVVGKSWKLRCKWWLNRHFNNKLLESEIAGGELPLMAYKAACASQMYGPGFHYVIKVGTMLRDGKDPLFMVLNTYVQGSSSFGFYAEFSGGGTKGMDTTSSSSWTQVFSRVGTAAEEENTRDEEKEGDDGDKKNVRRRGRPKAQDKGKGKKRGRPKKELVDDNIHP